jgi:hypothetical protein
MSDTPLSGDIESPYAYRIITPTLTHFFEKSGVFYEPRQSPYKDNYLEHNGEVYRPSILSAMIFVNYIFFSLAAFFIYKSFALILDNERGGARIASFCVPSLLFLSLSTVVHGYGGLTEGVSIAMVSALCYFLLSDRFILFSITCILSIFQRELVSLIMILYLLSVLRDIKYLKFFLVATAAFSIYFLLRAILQIPGSENQTNLASMVEYLTDFSLTRDFIFQAIISNNIPFFIIISTILIGCRDFKPLLPYFLIAVVLFILGIATGIENNVGRILNLGTPILLICFAQILKHIILNEKNSKMGLDKKLTDKPADTEDIF